MLRYRNEIWRVPPFWDRRLISLVLLSISLSAFSTISAQTRVVSDGSDMVYVPAMTFLMGDSTADADEQPVHAVTVSAFLIDRTEVTYTQFRTFLEENPQWRRENADPDAVDADYLRDWNGLEYPRGKADHPVVWVSWQAAAAYAAWRNARLPTEAEWEAAARGTDGRLYPWGSCAPDSGGVHRCNYRAVYPMSDGFEQSAPVGQFPEGASPVGAMDMAGNVWEWVADWHDPEYYAESADRNPTGPLNGTYKVLRGGSWYVPARWVRSTVRMRAHPTRSADQVGFRCARSVDH